MLDPTSFRGRGGDNDEVALLDVVPISIYLDKSCWSDSQPIEYLISSLKNKTSSLVRSTIQNRGCEERVS